ncbi:MAG: serine hydrolase domain-containing protein [Gemmatimonadaceae bacterium]
MHSKIAIVGLSLIAFVPAQTDPGPRIDVAIQNIRSQVPGLSVAVLSGGRVIYAKGFGTISLSETRPPNPDTQYRLASLSKPITATAVFALVDQGKIDLDKPARDYCAALTPLDGAPTVRHFLMHQSGMRHTNDDEDESIVGEYPRLEPSLARITKERLKFSPGRKTLYTSWGYAALGCVIESVTNQSYADAIRKLVLAPSAMKDTTFDSPSYSSPTFSPGFRMSGRFLPSVIVDTRFKTPASGIISTVNDLARFANALIAGQLISGASFQEMVAIRKAPEDDRPLFTAGWTIGPTNLGTLGFNYNGSMEGSTAFLVILPEPRIAVAVLTNRERFVPGVTPVVREALRAALGLPSQ